MNKQLRQAIYQNRMMHNTLIKCKNHFNLERYREQRNHVNKIKKRSIKTYVYERCLGGPKSSDFWPTIKTLFIQQKQQLQERYNIGKRR